MGNLYTHITKRKSDPRIAILGQLKVAWRTTPRNMDKIKKLQIVLENIEKKADNPKRQPLKGIFNK